MNNASRVAAALATDSFKLEMLSDGNFIISGKGAIHAMVEVSYADAFHLVFGLMEFLNNQAGTPEMVDELGVFNFAEGMITKLAQKRREGRGGWHDPDQCRPETLAKMLIDHLVKGDPVDIGNFAMMLYNRDDAGGVLGDVTRAWLDEITPPSPTATEVLALATELGTVKGKLDATLNNQAKQDEQLKLARRDRDELEKAVEHLRQELELSQRNLARSLGYIDRITESEPPSNAVRAERFESVGNVACGSSFTNQRGPVLEQPPYRTGLNGFR